MHSKLSSPPGWSAPWLLQVEQVDCSIGKKKKTKAMEKSYLLASLQEFFEENRQSIGLLVGGFIGLG